MQNQPKVSVSKFTGMFTEATERIEQAYKARKKPPKPLFGKFKKEEKE